MRKLSSIILVVLRSTWFLGGEGQYLGRAAGNLVSNLLFTCELVSKTCKCFHLHFCNLHRIYAVIFLKLNM